MKLVEGPSADGHHYVRLVQGPGGDDYDNSGVVIAGKTGQN